MAFWIGEVSGSWFGLYSQASATVLSPMFKWHGNGDGSSWRLSSCEICAARNSFVLRVRDTCSSTENLYRHIFPVTGS